MKKHICLFFLCAIIILAIFNCISFNQYEATNEKAIEQIEEEIAAQQTTPEPLERTTVLTAYKSDAKVLWDMINKYSPNEYTTAAIIGMIYRESAFRSDGVTGWPSCADPQESEKFTATIDAGLQDGSSKEKFINDVHYKYGGYGLGQWSSFSYLSEFYDYAQTWGTSIGDADMQCSFILWYIEEHNPYHLWDYLLTVDSAYDAGLAVGKYYEGTVLPESSASFAKHFYELYALTN